MSGCVRCLTASKCLTCDRGYLNYPSDNGNPLDSCLPCKFPCMECIGADDFCVSCHSGYEWIAGRCINNMINYYFTTNFSTDPTTFLANYGALNQQLVQAAIRNNARGLGLLLPTEVNFSSSNTSVRYSGIISS